jgi:DNA-binding GntR family transcriptional regulator
VEIEIDIRSKVPSYRQLADQIRAAIAAGEYAADDPIPSLRQLEQRSGLAQATVQHAIRVLIDEGLVYTVTGRGTFATGHSPGEG